MDYASAASSSAKEEQNAAGVNINENPELKAQMLKFVEKRRKLQSGAKLVKLDMTSEDMDELYDKMKCQECNNIPNTQLRFCCPRGHFYCSQCVEKRTNQPCNEKSRAICGFKMDPKDLTRSGYGHGLLSFNWQTNLSWQEQLKVKGDDEKKEKACLLELKYFPPDPIFTQVFQNSEWKCPLTHAQKSGDVYCTEENVKGSDMHKHLKDDFERVLLKVRVGGSEKKGDVKVTKK